MNARLLVKVAAAATLAACLTGNAKADVKIVSTVNVTGQMMRPNPNANPNQPPDFPQTITVYYKGADARVESSNGEVKIFKGVEGNVYSILPSKKIYFVRTYAEEASPRFGGRGGGNFKPNVSVSVSTDSAAAARTLGGMSSTRSTVSGTFTFPSYGGGRGGRGGFGGGNRGNGGGGAAPGAGANAAPGGATTAIAQSGSAPVVRTAQDNTTPPATPPAAPPARVINLTGEVWTSSGVTLPDDPKATALPSLVSLGRGFTMFITPLSDSLSKNKTIPLDLKVSYLRQSRNPDATPTPIVGTITTKSVSTVSLDPSLFTVPSDYTKVDPPAPMFGSGQRGRRGRGGNGGGGGGGGGANAAPGIGTPAPPAE